MRRLVLSALGALVLASVASSARAQDCSEGRVRVEGRCCWPGQSWSLEHGRCDGAPLCPPGLVEHGETCVASALSALPSAPSPPGARGRDAYAEPTFPRAASTDGWPVAVGDAHAPGAWVFPGRGEDEGLISVAFAIFDVGWLLGWIGVLADEAAGCSSDFFGSGRTFSCGGWQIAGVPLVGGIVGGLVNFSPGFRRSSFGIAFGIPSVILEGIGLFVLLPIAFANSTSEPAFMPIHLNDDVTASLELSAPGADAGLSLDVSF